jgi:hypothetical protein
MYPAYRAPHHQDERFPFLPFLTGLAVSPFLYGGFGPRPYYGYGRPRPFYGGYGYPYGGYPYGGYYGHKYW